MSYGVLVAVFMLAIYYRERELGKEITLLKQENEMLRAMRRREQDGEISGSACMSN